MKKAILYGLATFFVIVAVVFTGCAAPSIPNPTGDVTPASGAAPANSAPALSPPGQTTQSAPAQTTKPGNIASANPATGKLLIKVTDAPAKPQITGILVTVTSIEIHKAGPQDAAQTEGENESAEGTQEDPKESQDSGGWQTIEVDENNNSFDLFEVKDNPMTLASVFPESGKYSQIRMVVDKVFVDYTDNDGEHKGVEAKVPSGKIKFIHALDINPENATELLFDFDAAQSIVVTGNGQVIFKPVIKLSISKTQEKEQSGAEEEETQEEEADQGLNISTHKLANGKVGAEYSAELQAEGGSKPYEWSVTVGQLPAGLSLSENGAIAGQPTAEGNSTFTIQALDSQDGTATREFTIKIAAADLQK